MFLIESDIQSWWEVPSIAHFCSLFRTAFNLSDFDIEDLEEALLIDGSEDGSTLLKDLIVGLLHGILNNHEISNYNYQMYLRRVLRERWEQEGRMNPFENDVDFQFLPLRTKVEILYNLCDYRLDAEDVAELLKNFEADSLRVEPLGVDDDNSKYWYFYGTRLYREDIVNEHTKKKNFLCKKFKSNVPKNSPYGSSRSTWQVICYTEQDWEKITQTFENAQTLNEKQLFRTLKEDFLPEIPRLFAERERLQRKRILEMAPRRISSRIERLKQQKEENKLIPTTPSFPDSLTLSNDMQMPVKFIKCDVENTSFDEKKDQDGMSYKLQSRISENILFENNCQSVNKFNNKPDILTEVFEKDKIESDDDISLSSSVSSTANPGFNNGNEELISIGTRRHTMNSLSTVEFPIATCPANKIIKNKPKLRNSMKKVLSYLKSLDEAELLLSLSCTENTLTPVLNLKHMEKKLLRGGYQKLEQFEEDFQLLLNSYSKQYGNDTKNINLTHNLQKQFGKAVYKYITSKIFPTDENKLFEERKRGILNFKKSVECESDQNETDSSETIDSVNSDYVYSKKRTKIKTHKLDELNALAEETEQTLKDFNKWLEKSPVLEEYTFSNPAENSETIFSTQNIGSVISQSVRKKELSVKNKECRIRKDLRKILSLKNGKSLRKDKNIDRLPPGKIKGNLLNECSKEKLKNGTVYACKLIEKIKENKCIQSVCTSNSENQLSMGVVLDTNFISPRENIHDECQPECISVVNDTKKEDNILVGIMPDVENFELRKSNNLLNKTHDKHYNIPEDSKATPNLSAWFKAFGGPKSLNKTRTILAKDDDSIPAENVSLPSVTINKDGIEQHSSKESNNSCILTFSLNDKDYSDKKPVEAGFYKDTSKKLQTAVIKDKQNFPNLIINDTDCIRELTNDYLSKHIPDASNILNKISERKMRVGAQNDLQSQSIAKKRQCSSTKLEVKDKSSKIHTHSYSSNKSSTILKDNSYFPQVFISETYQHPLSNQHPSGSSQITSDLFNENLELPNIQSQDITNECSDNQKKQLDKLKNSNKLTLSHLNASTSDYCFGENQERSHYISSNENLLHFHNAPFLTSFNNSAVSSQYSHLNFKSNYAKNCDKLLNFPTLSTGKPAVSICEQLLNFETPSKPNAYTANSNNHYLSNPLLLHTKSSRVPVTFACSASDVPVVQNLNGYLPSVPMSISLSTNMTGIVKDNTFLQTNDKSLFREKDNEPYSTNSHSNYSNTSISNGLFTVASNPPTSPFSTHYNMIGNDNQTVFQKLKCFPFSSQSEIKQAHHNPFISFQPNQPLSHSVNQFSQTTVNKEIHPTLINSSMQSHPLISRNFFESPSFYPSYLPQRQDEFFFSGNIHPNTAFSNHPGIVFQQGVSPQPNFSTSYPMNLSQTFPSINRHLF